MPIEWTPSGPIVIVSTSATLYQFADDQVEGVAKIVNLGSSVGVVTLMNEENTLPDNNSIVNPGATFFVAFGQQQNYVITAAATLAVTPGYMLKDQGYLDKDVPIDVNDFEPFIWLDPSDITTLFQDAAMEIPVTQNGDPVGAILDKSGNGNHLTQATASARPLYKTSEGVHWLEFDGVDDSMSAAYGSALSNPVDRVSGFRRLSNQTSFRQFIHGSGNTVVLLQDAEGQLSIFDGVLNAVETTMPDVGVDFVVTERHNGADSRLAVDNNNYVTGNPGTVSATGIQLCLGTGGDFAKARFYGLSQFTRLLTDSEISFLRTYYADKQGRTL